MQARLLIVDDSAEMLIFLQRVLSTDYRVLTASDGKEAMETMQRETVHLVISDVLMPRIDGFQLCTAIKSNPGLSHIPVMLMTARRNVEWKVEALELGADAYMEKPFSMRLLQAQIRSLITNRNYVREFYVHSPLAGIGSQTHTKADEQFLTTLNSTIEHRLHDTGLDVDMLAGFMNMSRATLYRKIKGITACSPMEFINSLRLKRAAMLLVETSHKVYEVALLTGFNSQSSFSRNFQKQFKLTPSEFVRERLGERRSPAEK